MAAIGTIMRELLLAMTLIVTIGLVAHNATAQGIPDWIRNNAMWWADGVISEAEFVAGLQYLIAEDILKVPPTQVSSEKSESVPEWVKNSAKWWAEGTVSDTEFINSVQYLMKTGVISVASKSMPEEKTMATKTQNDMLQAELQACQEIKKAYDRIKCEDAVELKILTKEYKENATPYVVGPITFYYPGAELEVLDSGKANLNIRILAENSGANDNITLSCSGPSVCNYDVWDGSKAYKYASTDFTSGSITLKPGDVREINLFFGPNIGYGGTQFMYDSSKEYTFRISESWGSGGIPLGI